MAAKTRRLRAQLTLFLAVVMFVSGIWAWAYVLVPYVTALGLAGLATVLSLVTLFEACCVAVSTAEHTHAVAQAFELSHRVSMEQGRDVVDLKVQRAELLGQIADLRRLITGQQQANAKAKKGLVS